MRYHFIGIKGTGMSALACILADSGHQVSGSDIDSFIFTQTELEKRHIPISVFGKTQWRSDMQVVVGHSFDEDFPEVIEARKKGLNCVWYNDFLGQLMTHTHSISIAGTHGKSTTTGLLAHMLTKAAYLIGDGHGHMMEDAKHFVVESCEFKRHFLAYHPDVAIITNIELDHVDYYRDMDDYLLAFQQFINQVKTLVLIWGDDPYLPNLTYPQQVIRYGFSEKNDYRIENLIQDEHGSQFDWTYHGTCLAHLHIHQVSEPFLLDSLAAMSLAHHLGEKVEEIVERLTSFPGIARRSVIDEQGQSVFIDDYAHHPTAIRAMIETVRKKYPQRKVVAIFKPDRYSRLQYFLESFATSLSLADRVYICPFASNAQPEDETITVKIDDLLKLIPGAQLIDVDDSSAKKLAQEAPAVFVFMSSKNVYLLKDMLMDELS